MYCLGTLELQKFIQSWPSTQWIRRHHKDIIPEIELEQSLLDGPSHFHTFVDQIPVIVFRQNDALASRSVLNDGPEKLYYVN